VTVLAIDPGNEDSAYALWDGAKIHSFGKVSNFEMRGALRDCFSADVVAVEMVACYGMAVGATVFDTCRAVGRFEEIAATSGVRSELVYRRDVKLHHCKSAKAKDGNIAQALRDRFGVKGTKKKPGFFFGFHADVWQAFAIAVMVVDKAKIE